MVILTRVRVRRINAEQVLYGISVLSQHFNGGVAYPFLSVRFVRAIRPINSVKEGIETPSVGVICSTVSFVAFGAMPILTGFALIV